MNKKKHIVLARNKRVSEQGIDLDGQHMKFTQGTALWVADPGKARALQQKYPKDIAVTEDQQYTWHANNDGGNGTRMDNVHNYTFSGVDTSHFKVWVLKRGRLARVTKAQAVQRGYKIISSAKKRPDISTRNAKTAQGAEVQHAKTT